MNEGEMILRERTAGEKRAYVAGVHNMAKFVLGMLDAYDLTKRHVDIETMRERVRWADEIAEATLKT